MVFYNPCTRAYYEPDSYKLDPSRIPASVWPADIKHDGGIFANLYRDTSRSPTLLVAASPYPFQDTNIPLKTTSGDGDADQYMVQLNNGTMHLSHLRDLASVTVAHLSDSNTYASLLVFFACGAKVTMAHNGTYHKGFLLHLPGSSYRFSVRHHLSSKQEEWGVNLPLFTSEWRTLCRTHNMMIPSWVIPLVAVQPLPHPLSHLTLLRLPPLPWPFILPPRLPSSRCPNALVP